MEPCRQFLGGLLRQHRCRCVLVCGRRDIIRRGAALGKGAAVTQRVATAPARLAIDLLPQRAWQAASLAGMLLRQPLQLLKRTAHLPQLALLTRQLLLQCGLTGQLHGRQLLLHGANRL
ncbi:hypothetical protein DQ04_04051010 [Trypanosoma grayi]|uniref:hypothetical protein n=1 Tax=Trypanosoma grayi TaxID=71804 RepID=UPI0004F45E32|nr:hypothetical protein DQ04_04051010 [Trypanosoma grayi]KEG10202.1 hypothetical protein DQ04_04051010 [Trypanosoma grayi]